MLRLIPPLLLLSGLIHLSACSPVVRPAGFVGAPTEHTDATLWGPFDGQIVDAGTGEPIKDAVVVGIWSFDRGVGFVGPGGSHQEPVSTDEAGRYRIPSAPKQVLPPGSRLVSFELVVYKRGYAAYRSDHSMEGGVRHEFSARHNRIELETWRPSQRHDAHLLYLTMPPEVARVASWERELANRSLYRERTGQVPVGAGTSGGFGASPGSTSGAGGQDAPQDDEASSPKPETWLDVQAILPPEDVALRTGFEGEFSVGMPTDLPRTSFYHAVHFQAVDQAEEYDLVFRVWKDVPGGLEPVQETIQNSLPGVRPDDTLTDKTWLFEDPRGVKAVAFIDAEANAAVLLTCGAQQCQDMDTALILAKLIQARLDRARSVPAGGETTPQGPAAPIDANSPDAEERQP